METKKNYTQPESVEVIIGSQILLAGSGCSCTLDTGATDGTQQEVEG